MLVWNIFDIITYLYSFAKKIHLSVQNISYSQLCVGSKYSTFVTFDRRAILSIQGYNFCPFHHVTVEVEPCTLFNTFCNCLHIFIIILGSIEIIKIPRTIYHPSLRSKYTIAGMRYWNKRDKNQNVCLINVLE